MVLVDLAFVPMVSVLETTLAIKHALDIVSSWNESAFGIAEAFVWPNCKKIV